MERKRHSREGWDALKIRALRRHLGLTQQEMAQEIGARQQTISEWETGQYAPRGASSTLLTILAERADFRYGEERQEGGDRPGEG